MMAAMAVAVLDRRPVAFMGADLNSCGISRWRDDQNTNVLEQSYEPNVSQYRHIAYKKIVIGLNNGLSSVRRQAIVWTSARQHRTHFGEI